MHTKQLCMLEFREVLFGNGFRGELQHLSGLWIRAIDIILAVDKDKWRWIW